MHMYAFSLAFAFLLLCFAFLMLVLVPVLVLVLVLPPLLHGPQTRLLHSETPKRGLLPAIPVGIGALIISTSYQRRSCGSGHS